VSTLRWSLAPSWRMVADRSNEQEKRAISLEYPKHAGKPYIATTQKSIVLTDRSVCLIVRNIEWSASLGLGIRIGRQARTRSRW
jgi:hypothetical protein